MTMARNGRHARRWLLGLGLLPLLAGCAESIARQPSPTADSVFAAQYRASGTHGAITGEEVGKITDSYQQQIGAANAPPRADTADTADTADGGNTQGTTSAPASGSALGR